MIRPKKKEKTIMMGQITMDEIDGYNQACDDHTPYIEHLKKKPSVKEIAEILAKITYKSSFKDDIEFELANEYLKKAAKAIHDRLNKEELSNE